MNQQLPEDSLLNLGSYPKKRGRPRRFEACPECGAEGLYQTNQRKAGHCVNIYCECPACGAKVRYVTAGDEGHWVRVRSL
jgi:DNA-directed RNA polymerase subunit M/transcription elongation factor TFIIS